MVSNVFVIWRNRVKERHLNSDDEAKWEAARDKPDTILSCVKQRETGVEPTLGLWFHPQSCQFLERDGVSSERYITDFT